MRKTSQDEWLLISCTSWPAYTLSKGASIVVSADGAEARFNVTRGSALYFAQAVPEGMLLDAEGQPIDRTGVAIPEGQQVSTRQPQPTADAGSSSAASKSLSADLYKFGLGLGDEWVADAEQGDLVPVRGESRAPMEALADAGRVSEPAFDQPRTVVVTPVQRTTRSAVQPVQVGDAVTALRSSGVPTEVVIGQRFVRTRIIGNPGTTGGQQIRANPFAEQLIRLPGSRGSTRTPQYNTQN
jgi:hypothetical protein